MTIVKRKAMIPSTNEISAFMHCKLCLDELPKNKSPREYSQIECGWTKLGFQVWCKRHEVNMIHLDFEGCRHLANTFRESKAKKVKQ